jgi:uncharacterized protein YuzE
MANNAGIRVTYDPQGDVLAVGLGPLRKALGATEVSPDHYLHLDPKGRLVSIEILRASKHYRRSLLQGFPSPVRLLTLNETAAAAGLATTTLRSQIHAGRLPAVKRGRDWLVAEHDLWNYLDNRAPQGRRSNSKTKRSSKRRHRSRIPAP